MTPASKELPGKPASSGLRAPAESGQVLFSFPPGDLNAAVAIHQQRLASDNAAQLDGLSLQNLSNLGRTELHSAAMEWTGKYCDLPAGLESPATDAKPFVLSGHQPTLFHPGVWFKNFILSRLGRKLNAVAINLIIDNDISDIPAVMIPLIGTNRATWQSVAYDLNSARLPHEFHKLHDRKTLASFAERLTSSVSPWVDNPLVHRLWPHVLESANTFSELGFALAAGRHRLESELKLQTLEIPLSRVCQTAAFSHFVAAIFSRASDFASVHNRSLNQFREQHGIRSQSHPLPPLAIDGKSIELPFWIYSREFPNRKRLIVRQTANGTVFEGPDGRPVAVDSNNPAEQLHELSRGQICLRPRALLTTMYSRMVLSDLFVHGIGGAIYDQITDSIAAELFGWTLPPFATTTGTFRLAGWSPGSAASHLACLHEQLRAIHYHPETFVGYSTDTAALIQAKKQLVSEMGLTAGRRERHVDMIRLNAQLRSHLSERARLLEEEIESKKSLQVQNRIVASREVTFCAHPEALPREIAGSAASVF